MERRLDQLSVMLLSVTVCPETEKNLQQGSPASQGTKPEPLLAHCYQWSRLPFSWASLLGSWHLSGSLSDELDQKDLQCRPSLARFHGILQMNFFVLLVQHFQEILYYVYVYTHTHIYVFSIAVCQFSWKKKGIWKLENSNSRVVFKGITLHHSRPNPFIKVL